MRNDTKPRVLAALGMSEDDYAHTQFERGMEYLTNRATKETAFALSQDQDFWDWWVMAWESRDLVVAVRVERGLVSGAAALGEWEEIHEPAAIQDKVPRFVERRHA